MIEIDPKNDTVATQAMTPVSGVATLAASFPQVLGSVGPRSADQAVNIGRLGAPPAPGKRTGKKAEGGSDSTGASPTGLAVAELGSKGPGKATVEAAAGEMTRPAESRAGQAESKSKNGSSRGGMQPCAQAERTADEMRGAADDPSKMPGKTNPTATAGATQAVEHAIVQDSGGKTARSSAAAFALAAIGQTPAGQARVSRSGSVFSVERAQLTPARPNLRPVSAPDGGVKAGLSHRPPAPAPRSTEETEAAFAAQLERGFSAILRQSGGTLTLRLQPEALGELTIRMDLQPGQVAASFEVESDQAQRLLSDHMSALRSALEARGLGVDSLTVHVSERSAQDAPAWAESRGEHGGAEDSGGGAVGEDGRGRGHGGTDDPPRAAGAIATRSEDSSGPEAGATGMDSGGAQVVRLVLDAVA